ncbi:MAG TPA: 6-phosphofructokinase, partial [Candidatus Hydrogenedentes bacterium]|nr:6-phosphofructokinase [Candidatus Hydrogenedentota bacterium]
HNTGWLALGSGVASGADVILIPEIPYSPNVVAESLLERMRHGKKFSIVVVAEGATAAPDAPPRKRGVRMPKEKETKTVQPKSATLAEYLHQATGLETRITSLGYLQRGGIPTPTDRVLCTAFGAKAAELALARRFGNMVAKRGEEFVPVPLKEIAGKKRMVPLDHPLIMAARAVNTCLGDHV